MRFNVGGSLTRALFRAIAAIVPGPWWSDLLIIICIALGIALVVRRFASE